MSSKEEIEKAKEKLNKYVDKVNRNKRILEGSEIQTSEAIETLLQYIGDLESTVQAQNMVHKYDVNMIDEVKGEAVQLYNKIDKLNKIIDEITKQLAGWAMFDNELQKPIMLYTQEQVKQYFEKKVEGK